jgi:glucan phosphorylase
LQARTGIDLPTNPLYDVQIKRIHEYKRQYLNILSIIYRYHEIKRVGAVVNNDPDVKDLLKVMTLPSQMMTL